MHGSISGTIDYREPDDQAAIKRLRSLIALLPPDRISPQFHQDPAVEPKPVGGDIYGSIPMDPQSRYDVRDLISYLIHAETFDEYKADYGQTSRAVTQKSEAIRSDRSHERTVVTTAKEGMQFGG